MPRRSLSSFQPFPLDLLLHEHDAVSRTGNRATDVNQVALRIDTLDAQVRLCVALVAVLSRHLLALDDTRGIGARSNRAGTAMLRVAVRVRSAVEAVTLDDALKAAAFRRAGDFHLIARRKDSDGDRVAEVVGRDFSVLRGIVEPEAAKNCRCRRESGFRRVTNDCLVCSATAQDAFLALLRCATNALLAVSELHGGDAGGLR